MALPRIISVDDHVVEPPHVWQTWLPEKWRERGPAGRTQAVGLVQAPLGCQVRHARGPRGRVGRRLVLRRRAHLRAQEVRRHPAGRHDRGRAGQHRLRPHPDDDDRHHLRRHAQGLLGPRRAHQGHASSTTPTAPCPSRPSPASAARPSTRTRTRSSAWPASRRTTTGWSRSGAPPRAATTSRSASSRCGTSSWPRPRPSATRERGVRAIAFSEIPTRLKLPSINSGLLGPALAGLQRLRRDRVHARRLVVVEPGRLTGLAPGGRR